MLLDTGFGLEYSPHSPCSSQASCWPQCRRIKHKTKNRPALSHQRQRGNLFVFWLIYGPARSSSWALGMCRHVFVCVHSRVLMCVVAKAGSCSRGTQMVSPWRVAAYGLEAATKASLPQCGGPGEAEFRAGSKVWEIPEARDRGSLKRPWDLAGRGLPPISDLPSSLGAPASPESWTARRDSPREHFQSSYISGLREDKCQAWEGLATLWGQAVLLTKPLANQPRGEGQSQPR